MSCGSECVEISMMVEISVEDFLGIIKSLEKIKSNPNTKQGKYKENEQLSLL